MKEYLNRQHRDLEDYRLALDQLDRKFERKLLLKQLRAKEYQCEVNRVLEKISGCYSR